ncbi:unnamed protein product, partial [Prorocentrum cordatum]
PGDEHRGAQAARRRGCARGWAVLAADLRGVLSVKVLSGSEATTGANSPGGRQCMYPGAPMIHVFSEAFWFLLNISIGIVTKSLFLNEQVCLREYGCHNFKFPLAMTCIHLMTTQVFTYIHVFVIRGSANGPELDWPARVQKVVPLALCFAIAVGLGNVSLNYPGTCGNFRRRATGH